MKGHHHKTGKEMGCETEEEENIYEERWATSGKLSGEGEKDGQKWASVRLSAGGREGDRNKIKRDSEGE